MNKRTKRLIEKEMRERIRQSSRPICKACLKQESETFFNDVTPVCADCYDCLTRGDTIEDIRNS